MMAPLLLLLVVMTCADPVTGQAYGTGPYRNISGLFEGTCSGHYADPAARMIQHLYQTISEADCELASPCDYPADYRPIDREQFDFIVVGAGSAGATLAGRLSEQRQWRVLLLEAGGDPTKTSEVPELFPALQKTQLDWQYQTSPGWNNCLGMVDHRCAWPRGKVLGGSSTINYMFYVRGNAADYDHWEALGNKGWSYRDVLPYFKKSEALRAEEVLVTPGFRKYHGTKGPLKVETLEHDEVVPFGKAFAAGMRELGYPTNPDVNGRFQNGFTQFQGTLEDGRRCSTAKAYLTPAKGRRNLRVSKNSLTTKILINKNKKTAFGVEFINQDGKAVRVRATKEVILSAGSVNSPQLLMLSGIGPRDHLKKMGIEVLQDLPVGKNLQDHPLMSAIYFTLNFTKPTEPVEESLFDFLLKKKSSYSSLGAFMPYLGFINTLNRLNAPDIEISFAYFNKNDTTDMSSYLEAFNYRDDIINEFLKVSTLDNTALILAPILMPYSRGEIKLKSTDPKEYPEIIAGYFTDQRDIDTYLRFYDFATRLAQTEGFQRFGSKFHEVNVPPCKRFKPGSADYRECSIRHMSSTAWHPCCTNKMGAVVDSELRVRGVGGLRVVDASVMPTIVRGHTNAAVIMIAEKAADIIKNTWLSESRYKASNERRYRG